MSTATRSQTPPPQFPDDANPFRYGWRYVPVQKPDGSEDFEQVPLTLEDVLHPEEGDHIMNSDPHADDMTYLRTVFKSLLARDPHAVVLSDCGIDWNLPGFKPLSPDIAVFFGVQRRRRSKIFDVAAEHARPAVVIEVTSASTRSNDFGAKLELYHRAGVPVYVIADASVETPSARRLELIGYRHAPNGYERLQPGPDGRIWLEALQVWLGVVQDPISGFDRLACFNVQTNAEIGDYTAITKAHARAETEAAKAQAEALEARAQVEKAQAEALEARAKVEKAQARIRELEALLKRQAPDS